VATALHFDCFSGASGDMVLGALLDLGVPLDGLRAALGSLALDCGEVSASRVVRSGISATKFHVREHAGAGTNHPDDNRAGHHDPHDHGHHSLAEIAAFIDRSALSPAGKARAKRLFDRLGEAEAAIHEMPVEQVHLHEVGAIDSIVDIVGAVYALEWIGATEITASPLNVGSGTVRSAHGLLPVPAPATARLLSGAAVYSGAVAAELVTPTGALIVTDYAKAFGPMPPLRIGKIGYGAGDRDFPGHPNVLRVFLGETMTPGAADRVVVIECEIDDMSPQLFGPLMDRLYGAGALDVYYTSVMMKKNRPGVLVTVLAVPDRREAITGTLFAETTTIGVRYQETQRECLERQIRTLETSFGPVRFKVASRDGRVINAAPEFDDCARIASEQGLAVKDVQALALKAWMDGR
jgi:uncharacterized protein (TIGR00299 family) protein